MPALSIHRGMTMTTTHLLTVEGPKKILSLIERMNSTLAPGNAYFTGIHLIFLHVRLLFLHMRLLYLQKKYLSLVRRLRCTPLSRQKSVLFKVDCFPGRPLLLVCALSAELSCVLSCLCPPGR